MKKLAPVLISVLIFLSCKGSSDSSSDTGFSIQKGDLTALTSHKSSTSFNFIFGGTTYSSGYAIIYSGTIASIDRVGIAVSTDPSSSSAFNLKIYFPASSIPSGNYALVHGTATIKVTTSDGIYQNNSNDVTININTLDNSIYTIYALSTITLEKLSGSGSGPATYDLDITTPPTHQIVASLVPY